EDFGVGVGAFGHQHDLAARNGMTTALENQHHVVRCTATRAGQQHFHGAWGQVIAATFGCTVHGRHMTTACTGDEQHSVFAAPVDCAFHMNSFVCSASQDSSVD